MAQSQRPPAPPSGQPQQLRVPSLRPPGSLAPEQDTWEARPKYRTLLAALREVVVSAQSLKPLLLNAANLLHALLDAERVTIFALDPNNTFLRSLARSGGEAGFRVAKTNETIPGYVAITRRTVNVRNAQNPDELKAIHPDLRHDPAHDVGLTHRTRQVLAAPILGEKGLVGVIEFVNSLDGMDFRPDDARLAEEVAALVGPAIDRHTAPARSLRGEGAKYGQLVARGIVTDAQLAEAHATARKGDGDVNAVLVEQYRVPRDAIGYSLADYHHLRFFAWDGRYRMPKVLLDRVSPGFMRGQVCAPVALMPDGTMIFAIENPENIELVDAIRARRLAARYEFVVGTRRDILAYVDASVAAPAPSGVLMPPPLLAASEASAQSMAPKAVEAQELDVVQRLVLSLDERASAVPDRQDEPDDDVSVSGEPEAVIAKLVRQIVLDAAQRGASDVHIEPNGDYGPCRVRMRIDGDCVDYVAIPSLHRQALVQRVKVLADLDIAERRRPQDGRMRVRGSQGSVEVRVATVPTVGGDEDVVLRLLSAWKPMPLEDLGFNASNLAAFREMVAQPYGIVLVVGPTGSGKTTALHAALAHLNTPDMKIWTVEDPVEIVQPGLRQVQVNTRINLGFPEILRAFLRSDPDVIMVGEMRDRVTAAIGIEASLTGHLVLSTLQSNSAPETITRLLGMDIDTISFADALRGVLAQRLVRRLCESCRAPTTPTPEEWNELSDEYGLDAFSAMLEAREHPPVFYKAVGCKQCRGSGYRGRMAIHELLPGTDKIKQMIRRRATVDELRVVAAQDGMRTMLQDGIEKVLDGHTDYRQVKAACVTQ